MYYAKIFSIDVVDMQAERETKNESELAIIIVSLRLTEVRINNI